MIMDAIRSSQRGNQQATLDLVKKFSPALKKYARKLETEDAYYDLQADFLEIILHLDCDRLRITSDGAMVQYLSQSIYHAYIKRLRHLIDNKLPTVSVEDLTDRTLYQSSIFDKAHYDFSEIPPALLTPQEANAFYQVCILGCSAAEVAQKRGVTRQSVNQAKRKAILKLRQFFEESGPL